MSVSFEGSQKTEANGKTYFQSSTAATHCACARHDTASTTGSRKTGFEAARTAGCNNSTVGRCIKIEMLGTLLTYFLEE